MSEPVKFASAGRDFVKPKTYREVDGSIVTIDEPTAFDRICEGAPEWNVPVDNELVLRIVDWIKSDRAYIYARTREATLDAVLARSIKNNYGAGGYWISDADINALRGEGGPDDI